MKRADKAERLGRSVGSNLTDYESIARRGQDSLAAALISRHNQRMERVGAIQPELIRRLRVLVNQLFVLDFGLRKLGANPNRAPVDWSGGWVNQLSWGVDSILAATRLLLVGQFVGAAQIGRSQLERWAINLEHTAQLIRERGESTSSFYNRLWGTLDSTGVKLVSPTQRSDSGERISITGRRILPGELYDEVSSLLHGRGPGVAAAYLEACELLRSPSRGPSLEAGHQILDMLELCIERIRVCIAWSLAAVGDDCNAERLLQIAQELVGPAGSSPYPRWSLWPLNPLGLSPKIVARLRRSRAIIEKIHNGERPAGRLYRDDELSELFFLERRARSVEVALSPFEKEAEMRGESLKSLQLPDLRFAITAEVLGLVAVWNSRPSVASAASIASSALRSSYWLWLEDDDRAMGILRVALEATARLKTWTRNPAKTAKLEGLPSTTPRDWLDAAGWRRLKALNLALGELAHTRANSRWGGARDLLVHLQPVSDNPEPDPQRGRGFALDAVSALSARTALEAVAAISGELKDHLQSLMDATGTFNEVVDNQLKNWLDRNWDLRSFNFGQSVFTRPTSGDTDQGNPGTSTRT